MTTAKRSTTKRTTTKRSNVPDEPPEFSDSFRVLHVYVRPGRPLGMDGDHFEPYELRAIADFLMEQAEPPPPEEEA